jgi:cell wall-associated NlpC family hydrolase
MITGTTENGFLPVMGVGVDGRKQAGYVPEANVQPYDQLRNEDWTGWAEKFVGAPYKWGGRSATGLDCSALVQLSLAASRYFLPRDTSPQFQLLQKQAQISETRYKPHDEQRAGNFGRGDLIYWKGHVAICVDAQNIIHANAFHHCVAVEPRETAFSRIAVNFGPPIAHFRRDALRQTLSALDDL